MSQRARPAHEQPAASPEYSPFTHKTLTIHQVADLCGVTVRTVYEWVRLGKVAYVRIPSGHVRIYRDSVFHVPCGTEEQRETARNHD